MGVFLLEFGLSTLGLNKQTYVANKANAAVNYFSIRYGSKYKYKPKETCQK